MDVEILSAYNSGTKETYKLMTNSKKENFNNIINAISILKKQAKDDEFKIGLNFVITMQNYKEMIVAIKIALEAKADYIRFEPEYYSALAHETIYSKLDEINSNLLELKCMSTDNFEVSVPKLDRGAMDKTTKLEGDFVSCHYCNFVTALGADGYMYPCPQIHLNKQYRMGNAIELGYKEWVKSGEKEKWFEQHPDRTEFCKTCFYRPQNELLEWLYNGKLNYQEVLNQYNQDVNKTLHKDFV